MTICCIRHAVQIAGNAGIPCAGPVTVPATAPADCGKTFEQFITEWSQKIDRGKHPQKVGQL